MKWQGGLRQPGVLAALGAAFLFGAGTPLAKLLLNAVNPWLLAGLLYLGSGLGMALLRRVMRAAPARMARSEWPWFLGAILSGGVIAPVLLMLGLSRMPAAGASLLLNAEGVFTALLAWFVFRENFDRRIALGMAAILAGALVLSWPGGTVELTGLWPPLAILAACFAWGLDNNLTRKVSLSDATWIASTKGLVAGCVNLVLAALQGSSIPAAWNVGGALLVGFLAYGVSLALFVLALRHLGTARTGAYFSVAPFFGAVLAMILGDPLTTGLVVAAVLMGIGVWLHLTERHEHRHTHESIEHEHEHEHRHEEHHQHPHAEPVSANTRHSHRHRHDPTTHDHPHYPDAHHDHDH